MREQKGKELNDFQKNLWFREFSQISGSAPWRDKRHVNYEINEQFLYNGRHHEFLYEWDYDVDKAGATKQTASISFSLRFASWR